MSRTTNSLLAKLKKSYPDAVYIVAGEEERCNGFKTTKLVIEAYVKLPCGKFMLSEATLTKDKTQSQVVVWLVQDIKEQYNAKQTA